jgi:hypothetical protein
MTTIMHAVARTMTMSATLLLWTKVTKAEVITPNDTPTASTVTRRFVRRDALEKASETGSIFFTSTYLLTVCQKNAPNIELSCAAASNSPAPTIRT